MPSLALAPTNNAPAQPAPTPAPDPVPVSAPNPAPVVPPSSGDSYGSSAAVSGSSSTGNDGYANSAAVASNPDAVPTLPPDAAQAAQFAQPTISADLPVDNANVARKFADISANPLGLSPEEHARVYGKQITPNQPTPGGFDLAESPAAQKPQNTGSSGFDLSESPLAKQQTPQPTHGGYDLPESKGFTPGGYDLPESVAASTAPPPPTETPAQLLSEQFGNNHQAIMKAGGDDPTINPDLVLNALKYADAQKGIPIPGEMNAATVGGQAIKDIAPWLDPTNANTWAMVGGMIKGVPEFIQGTGNQAKETLENLGQIFIPNANRSRMQILSDQLFNHQITLSQYNDTLGKIRSGMSTGEAPAQLPQEKEAVAESADVQARAKAEALPSFELGLRQNGEAVSSIWRNALGFEVNSPIGSALRWLGQGSGDMDATPEQQIAALSLPGFPVPVVRARDASTMDDHERLIQLNSLRAQTNINKGLQSGHVSPSLQSFNTAFTQGNTPEHLHEIGYPVRPEYVESGASMVNQALMVPEFTAGGEISAATGLDSVANTAGGYLLRASSQVPKMVGDVASIPFDAASAVLKGSSNLAAKYPRILGAGAITGINTALHSIEPSLSLPFHGEMADYYMSKPLGQFLSPPISTGLSAMSNWVGAVPKGIRMLTEPLTQGLDLAGRDMIAEGGNLLSSRASWDAITKKPMSAEELANMPVETSKSGTDYDIFGGRKVVYDTKTITPAGQLPETGKSGLLPSPEETPLTKERAIPPPKKGSTQPPVSTNGQAASVTPPETPIITQSTELGRQNPVTNAIRRIAPGITHGAVSTHPLAYLSSPDDPEAQGKFMALGMALGAAGAPAALGDVVKNTLFDHLFSRDPSVSRPGIDVAPIKYGTRSDLDNASLSEINRIDPTTGQYAYSNAQKQAFHTARFAMNGAAEIHILPPPLYEREIKAMNDRGVIQNPDVNSRGVTIDPNPSARVPNMDVSKLNSYGPPENPQGPPELQQSRILIRGTPASLDAALTHEMSHPFVNRMSIADQDNLFNLITRQNDPNVFTHNYTKGITNYDHLPSEDGVANGTEPYVPELPYMTKEDMKREMITENLSGLFKGDLLTKYSRNPGLIRGGQMVLGNILERMGIDTTTGLSTSILGVKPSFGAAVVLDALARESMQKNVHLRTPQGVGGAMARPLDAPIDPVEVANDAAIIKGLIKLGYTPELAAAQLSMSKKLSTPNSPNTPKQSSPSEVAKGILVKGRGFTQDEADRHVPSDAKTASEAANNATLSILTERKSKGIPSPEEQTSSQAVDKPFVPSKEWQKVPEHIMLSNPEGSGMELKLDSGGGKLVRWDKPPRQETILNKRTGKLQDKAKLNGFVHDTPNGEPIETPEIYPDEISPNDLPVNIPHKELAQAGIHIKSQYMPSLEEDKGEPGIRVRDDYNITGKTHAEAMQINTNHNGGTNPRDIKYGWIKDNKFNEDPSITGDSITKQLEEDQYQRATLNTPGITRDELKTFIGTLYGDNASQTRKIKSNSIPSEMWLEDYRRSKGIESPEYLKDRGVSPGMTPEEYQSSDKITPGSPAPSGAGEFPYNPEDIKALKHLPSAPKAEITTPVEEFEPNKTIPFAPKYESEKEQPKGKWADKLEAFKYNAEQKHRPSGASFVSYRDWIKNHTEGVTGEVEVPKGPSSPKIEPPQAAPPPKPEPSVYAAASHPKPEPEYHPTGTIRQRSDGTWALHVGMNHEAHSPFVRLFRTDKAAEFARDDLQKKYGASLMDHVTSDKLAKPEVKPPAAAPPEAPKSPPKPMPPEATHGGGGSFEEAPEYPGPGTEITSKGVTEHGKRKGKSVIGAPSTMLPQAPAPVVPPVLPSVGQSVPLPQTAPPPASVAPSTSTTAPAPIEPATSESKETETPQEETPQPQKPVKKPRKTKQEGATPESAPLQKHLREKEGMSPGEAHRTVFLNETGKAPRDPGGRSTWRDLPVTGVPAPIRYLNPSGMWDGPSARKFGSFSHGIISGGNHIAQFDTPEQGAAAQFDLLNSRSYVGKSVVDVVRKWTESKDENEIQSYANAIAKAGGISPDDIITTDFLKGKGGIELAKEQAKQESGKSFPMTDDQWRTAQAMAYEGVTGPSSSSLSESTGTTGSNPMQGPAKPATVQPSAPSAPAPVYNLPEGAQPVTARSIGAAEEAAIIAATNRTGAVSQPGTEAYDQGIQQHMFQSLGQQHLASLPIGDTRVQLQPDGGMIAGTHFVQGDAFHDFLLRGQTPEAMQVINHVQDAIAGKNDLFLNYGSAPHVEPGTVTGTQREQAQTLSPAQAREKGLSDIQESGKHIIPTYMSVAPKAGEPNTVTVGGVSPDKIIENSSHIAHELGPKSPYPPMIDKGSAHEDLRGYLSNVSNGVKGSGEGKLTPLPGHEEDVPQTPADFTPYLLGKKASFWNLAINGPDSKMSQNAKSAPKSAKAFELSKLNEGYAKQGYTNPLAHSIDMAHGPMPVMVKDRTNPDGPKIPKLDKSGKPVTQLWTQGTLHSGYERINVPLIKTIHAGGEEGAPAIHVSNEAATKALQEKGLPPSQTVKAGFMPGELKSSTPADFIKARDKTTRAGYLSPLAPEDIKDHKLYVNNQGTVGAAVDPHGDIQNVFNNGGPKGAGADAVVHAISKGGKTLDAFDNYLPKLYRQFGFQETGRMKFNPDYAPQGWDYAKDDNPDVVFMAHKGYPPGGPEAAIERAKGDKGNWIKNEHTDKYEDDYDAAKQSSRRAVHRGGTEVSGTHGETGRKASYLPAETPLSETGERHRGSTSEGRAISIGNDQGETNQTGQRGSGIAATDTERLGAYRQALQEHQGATDRIDRAFRQGGKPHSIDVAAEESSKQIPALRRLAEARGELLQPMEMEPDASGAEHHVWFSNDGKTVTKETYYRDDPAHGERKRFGAVPTTDAVDVRDATPHEYLDRIGINNDMGRKTRVVGVVYQGNGETRIRTEEPAISDAVSHPSMDEIAAHMHSQGFEPQDWKTQSWHNPKTKVLASDAAPHNFLKTDHGIEPVDLMLRHANNVASRLTDQDRLAKNEQQRSQLVKQQAKLDTTKPEEDKAWDIMASKIHDLEREHERLSESVKSGPDDAPRGTKAGFMPGDLLEHPETGERETVAGKYVKFPSGNVYTHPTMHALAQADGIANGEPEDSPVTGGYISSTGRLMSDEEGWALAKASKQLKAGAKKISDMTESEKAQRKVTEQGRSGLESSDLLPARAAFMPGDTIEKNGERERIKSPAVKFPTGEVYEGEHHPDAQDNGIKDGRFAADAITPGYTTEPTDTHPDGRFVGMHEGWKIGKQSSQIHPDVDPNKGFLNSEDLSDYPHPEDRDLTQTPQPVKAAFMPMAGKRGLGYEEAEREGRIFEGPDSFPRYEISDRDMRSKNSSGMGMRPGETYKLGDKINHPSLFRDYPDAKNINIKYDPHLRTQGGFNEHDGEEGTIKLKAYNDFDTLTHEIQHWIQAKEGWTGRGVSPEDAASRIDISSIRQKAKEEYIKAHPSDANYNDMQNYMSGAAREAMMVAYQEDEGETEARVAMSRRTMTPEERLSSPPEGYSKAQFMPRERKLTKQQMLDEGADGYLNSGYRMSIPISQITGREPVPEMEGGYKKGTPVTQPVEVEHNPDAGTYTLYSGNHRVRQAEINGETHVPAFVEAKTYPKTRGPLPGMSPEESQSEPGYPHPEDREPTDTVTQGSHGQDVRETSDYDKGTNGSEMVRYREPVKAAFMPMGGVKGAGFADAEREGRTFTNPYDKLPRYEISDHDMQWKNPVTYKNGDIGPEMTKNEKERLGNIINHPELFKSYPSLKNVNVEYDPRMDGASFYHRDPTDPDATGLIKIGDIFNKNNWIHEIQHAIQRYEGFQGLGSGREQAQQDLDIPRIRKDASDAFQKTPKDQIRARIKELNPNLSNLDLDYWTQKKQRQENYSRKIEMDNAAQRATMDRYHSDAGEIEAREAAIRRSMSPEDRAERPPFNPEDSASHYIEPNKAHFMPSDNSVPVEYRKNAKGEETSIKIPFDITHSPLIANKQPEDINAKSPDTLPKDQYGYLSDAARRKLSAYDKISATGTFANKIASVARKALKDPEVAAGIGWYSRMRDLLSKAFGENHEMFSHLLGVTSPTENPVSNFLYALEAYDRWEKGHFDKNIDLYKKGYEMKKLGTLIDHVSDELNLNVPTNKKGEVTDAGAMAAYIRHHGLEPLRENGLQYGFHGMGILQALSKTWMEESHAPKTRNYSGNLLGTTTQATIDTWMARLMRQIGHEGYSEQWRLQPENEGKISDMDFGFSQLAFDKATAKLKVDGKPMNADDLQALLWFHIKGEWEKNGWMKPGTAGAEKSSLDVPFHAAFPQGPTGSRLPHAQVRKAMKDLLEEKKEERKDPDWSVPSSPKKTKLPSMAAA